MSGKYHASIDTRYTFDMNIIPTLKCHARLNPYQVHPDPIKSHAICAPMCFTQQDHAFCVRLLAPKLNENIFQFFLSDKLDGGDRITLKEDVNDYDQRSDLTNIVIIYPMRYI